MSWSNRYKDWKNANLIFKWRFRDRRRHGILNSLLKGAGHKNIAVLGYFYARVMT